MKKYSPLEIIRIADTGPALTKLNLIEEKPLSVIIQGIPCTIIMRTPGNESEHIAGFCLGEGIIDSPGDIKILSYSEGNTDTVEVTLTGERAAVTSDIITGRGIISQNCCGISGNELAEKIRRRIHRVMPPGKINPGVLVNAVESLGSHQPLRAKTRATHAVAACSEDGTFLSVAEDAGRHNALDKAIGFLFLKNRLKEAAFIVLSSRISCELVQKAAMAGIPVIMAVSRPTMPAVELCSDLGMTLACTDKKGGLLLFCGKERIYGI